MKKQIGVIVGSLRKESYSKKVATEIIKMLPEDFEGHFIEIGDLPLYNEDLDADSEIPRSWQRFRDEAKYMDGFIFVTPEYNRSYPAVIKNALDVGSRPYGHSIWDGKPAAVISVSPGAIGGFGANHHLRQVLVFLNMPTLQQPEAYIGNAANLLNEDGTFKSSDTKGFVQQIVDTYVALMNQLKK